MKTREKEVNTGVVNSVWEQKHNTIDAHDLISIDRDEGIINIRITYCNITENIVSYVRGVH